MITYRLFTIFLFILSLSATAQTATWIRAPRHQWPPVSLSNHVQFKNGDTYVHPSFQYAGTGFTLFYQKKIFAITAKHILWVAKNKGQNTVSINNKLKSWVMKSKMSRDSVIVNELINEDTTEILEGPASSILERDIIVFSVKQKTPGIQALIPRFSDAIPGETVFIIGNPYHEKKTLIYETKVVRKLGMEILLEQRGDGPYSGFSGSPVVDANGQVIGVFSSTSSDPVTAQAVVVLTSMEYLKNVLDKKPDVNKAKEDYGKLILNTVIKKGPADAILLYESLVADSKNYYKYNLRNASGNGLRETGEKLVEMNRLTDAIDILEYNVKINTGYFHDYNVLAKTYLAAGNKQKAIEIFRISTSKFDDKEENEAFRALEVLGGKNE